MILNLQKFLAQERPFWTELEEMLGQLANDPDRKLSRAQAERFHYLYERAASGLARTATLTAEPDLHRYLEALVARAYGEIHETRERGARFNFGTWFTQTFPQTFRRHIVSFRLACAIFGAGAIFGAASLALDPPAKSVLIGPFGHLAGSPSERVAMEESTDGFDHMSGRKSRFSTMLMTHNTRVSITTMAMGMTWGVGTVILGFYNGVILGAVSCDYILDGQTIFLLGWLLPHGATEIPALLIAAQAGLLIAATLIGRGSRKPLVQRFREAAPDLVTLIGGVAILLVWAGIIEAFLSQYHAPILPYSAKIAFGTIELAALILFLTRSGRGSTKEPARAR